MLAITTITIIIYVLRMVVFGKGCNWSWGNYYKNEEGQVILFLLGKDMEFCSFISDVEA